MSSSLFWSAALCAGRTRFMRDRKHSIPGDGIWSGDAMVVLIQTSDSKTRASIASQDVFANVIIEENQVSESKKPGL